MLIHKSQYLLLLLLGHAALARYGPEEALKRPATNGIVYSPINVWPYPKLVTFADAVGPHALAAAVTVVGCEDTALLALLAKETLGVRSVYRAPIRSYDEVPYEQVDAKCQKEWRCQTDSDCKGTRNICFTDYSRRYNSTHACPPSSLFNTPCGCCVAGKRAEAISSNGQRSGSEAIALLPTISKLTITCQKRSPQPKLHGVEAMKATEGYTLDVSADAVTVTAAGTRGAAYALATLAQLLRWDPAANATVLDRVPVHIEDEPVHAWRGIMLDVSRHFIPMAQVLPIIDAMFAAKMNVFHFHLTDAPSVPFPSKLYPNLASEGSWAHGAGNDPTIYSEADMAALVSKCEGRLVQLVLELDTPAHTMAWGRGYPKIMADCWEWMANANPKVDVDSDDCMALDPTPSSPARAFVSGVLSVHTVLTVLTVYTVLTVLTVLTILTVNTVLTILTVYTVLTILTVYTVLTIHGVHPSRRC
jgi:hypothetical protein